MIRKDLSAARNEYSIFCPIESEWADTEFRAATPAEVERITGRAIDGIRHAILQSRPVAFTYNW
jgi:hypothetical protein